MEFEGMTIRPALCLMTSFLQHAATLNPQAGALIEFGTFRGRVSSLLGQMQRSEDKLHLVDIQDYLDHGRMATLGLQYKFHNSSSEKWDIADAGSLPFWISHHDASHYFSNVSCEMAMMVGRMSKHAVMVLDDFTDPYSQVRAAYYHQRYVKNNPFELLMVGYGKGILVRTEVFSVYESFILDVLQPEMHEMGCSTTLYRTDVCPESRAFSIANKKLPADADRYGLNIWGDRFYRVSKP